MLLLSQYKIHPKHGPDRNQQSNQKDHPESCYALGAKRRFTTTGRRAEYHAIGVAPIDFFRVCEASTALMIISVANQKGGAAKTTSAVNLAAGLVLEGYKVLLLDMDPQTNATQVFLHPDVEVELEQSLYSSLIHYSPITPLIRKTALDNLDFVPSHIRMSGVDLDLAHVYDNRSARLRRALNGVSDRYDYVIIDNPPALGLLTVNSFVASDKILIPVSTGFFALTGLVQLLETVEMVKQTQLNPKLDIVGVLCTFSERTNVSSDVERQLRDHFDSLVFDIKIPKNISLEEAHSNHTHIFEYAPTSAGARAYKALVKEVLAR